MQKHIVAATYAGVLALWSGCAPDFRLGEPGGDGGVGGGDSTATTSSGEDAPCATNPCVLATGDFPDGIAVDATSVFWVNHGSYDPSVMMVPKDGGTPTTLASDLSGPSFIAIDETSIYFTNAHELRTMPKEGSAPPVHLITTDACKIAIDSSYILARLG